MKQKNFKTSIGGQALIEGVLMRGPARSAMAVRTAGGQIDVEQWDTASAKTWYRKWLFVRGIFNMADSLLFGYKCLMKSAEKAGLEEEEPSKFEKWLAARLGKSLGSVVSVLALVLAVAMAVLLFSVLPAFAVGGLARLAGLGLSPLTRSLLEGVVRIGVFLIYLALVSRLADIRRVFAYHGAEHKTIACYEAGDALAVENVRPKTRFHPRCGTSFLLIVLVISILVSAFVTAEALLPRVALKLALLPVIVGISYEIIKAAGRYDNALTRFVSAPGLWLQRLTTNEPDDSQIEVAIAAMLPAIPPGEGQDKW